MTTGRGITLAVAHALAICAPRRRHGCSLPRAARRVAGAALALTICAAAAPALAVAYSVSLVSDHRAVNVPDTYTLTATVDPAAPSTAVIQIRENGTGTLVQQCYRSYGTTCPVTTGPSWEAQTTPGTHTYHADVLEQNQITASSGTVDVDWRPFPFKVGLALDTFALSGQSPTASAHATVNYPLQYNTSFRLQIRQIDPATNLLGSTEATCWYAPCDANVGGSHVYVAVINSGGRIYAQSLPVELTPEGIVSDGIDGIDVLKLAALYGSVQQLCDTLLPYPGTHFSGHSTTDQWEACDAAQRAGLTLRDALRRIAGAAAAAATAAGVNPPNTDDSPLSWLLYPPTAAQPGNSAGSVAPQTLPAAWPVAAVRDRLIELNPALELTTAEATAVARQCLWLAAKPGLKSSSDCTSLPIFASGSDIPEATNHDLEALDPNTAGGNPGWVALNYEPGQAFGKPGYGWAANDPRCERVSGDGKACDEYPFFATQQGGPNISPTPHVEAINSAQNSLQGSWYWAFAKKCFPGADGNPTPYSPFLGIPIPPAANIPTIRSLCNKGG